MGAAILEDPPMEMLDLIEASARQSGQNDTGLFVHLADIGFSGLVLLLQRRFQVPKERTICDVPSIQVRDRPGDASGFLFKLLVVRQDAERFEPFLDLARSGAGQRQFRTEFPRTTGESRQFA